MKGTIKGESPDSLEIWKKENLPIYAPSIPPWGTLPSSELSDLRQQLWREQGGLCAYCGRLISLGARVNGVLMNHVEHFRPRMTYEVLTFDHDNLLLSCGKGYDEVDAPTSITCGDAKDQWFDENLIVPPDEDECRSRFGFTEQGTVEADTGDAPAVKMIEILNLNESQLRELRKRTWSTFIDMLLLDERVAPSKDAILASRSLQLFELTDKQGALKPFAHVVSSLARR